MANTTETINILRIDGTQAVTTLRQLKEEIEKDKDALVALGLVEEDDEKKKAQQDAITAKLANDLKLLNQVQNAAKVTTLAVAKATDVSTASYYDMQKALTTLKKAWKEMDAAERASAEGQELLQKIKQLDLQLKTLDGNIGQYQRNVGNYGQTFKEALDKAQQGAMGFNQGLTALSGIVSMNGEKTETFTKIIIGLQTAVMILTSAKGLTDLLKKGKEAFQMLTGVTKATETATDAVDAATTATKTATTATQTNTAAKGASAAATATAAAETTTLAGAMEGEAAATEMATAATHGFKAALLSTGVGALIVAIGSLIALISSLSSKYKELSNIKFDDMKADLQDLQDEMTVQLDLYKARGAVSEEAINKEIRQLKQLEFEYSKFHLTMQQVYGDDSEQAQEAADKWIEQSDKARAALNSARVTVESFITAANTKKLQREMGDFGFAVDQVNRRVAALKTTLELMARWGIISTEEMRKKMLEVTEGAIIEIDDLARAAHLKRLSQENAYWQRMLGVVEKGSDEQLEVMQAAAKAAYDNEVANAKATIQDRKLLQKTLLALERQYQQTLDRNEDAWEESRAAAAVLALKNRADMEVKGSREYYAAMQAVREAEYANLLQREGETDEQFKARRIAAYDAILKAQEDYDRATLAETTATLKARKAMFDDDSLEGLTAAAELAKAELDGIYQQIGESDAAFLARQLEALRNYYDAVDALTAAQFDKGLAAEVTYNQEKAQALAESLNTQREMLAAMHQEEGESEEEFNERRLSAVRQYYETKNELAAQDAAAERERNNIEDRIALLQESSFEYLAAEIELKQYELETLHQLEGESNDDFRQRQLAAEKEYYDAKKKMQQQWLSTMAAASQAVSGIFGSLADIYEADGKEDAKAQKKAKNLRIAGATIDMFQGATTAYATAQSLGPIAGPIIGGINAAAVITAGMANIAKIRAQDVSGNSDTTAGAAPAAVEAPTVEPVVNQVRNVTSASEEDRLNQMARDQRVYILSSDIEADRQQKRVQVAESSF